MKAKTFDCVQMKRKGAERILRELQSLKNLEDERSYWKRANQEAMRGEIPK